MVEKASAMGSHMSMIAGLLVMIYFNFIHPNDIPSVWYGLVASIMGLLLGTALYPTKIITPSADQ